MFSTVLAAVLCCTLHGSVHTGIGAPVADATVTASQGVAAVSGVTDERGSFSVRLAPGTYAITASARGYLTEESVSVDIRTDVKLDIVLESADSGHLRPIGAVYVNGHLAISRNPTPRVTISRKEFENLGYDRVIDALPEVPSVTLPRPDGGSSAAPAVVALRGPDPSETLVTLDGQLLNDANTGDLDLSRLPIAAFTTVDVTEGLGPRDLDGANTIGGALNLVSLAPTRTPHSAFSLSTGSFGQNEGWLNYTGSHGKLGFALAGDDQQERGYVNQPVLLCASNPCSGGASLPLAIGSSISSRSALANLIWNFSPQSDLGVRIFSLGNLRDLSASENAPDPSDPAGRFVGVGAISLSQNVRSYDLRARIPLGAGFLVGDAAFSNNTVSILNATAGGTPYDVSHQDKRQTVSLTWNRDFESGEIALGGSLGDESLTEAGVNSAQRQRISTLFARGSIRPSARWHLSGAGYASSYSTFGTSIDGRLGAAYDLNDTSALRFSIGTGFRAPLLIERYVFDNSNLPAPNADCIITGQGNANERAEHATEYELGYAKRLPSGTVDASVYRTNLRDPIENYYPVPACPTVQYSYPINVGNVIYQGAAVRYIQRFGELNVRAQYGLNVAYPYNLPSTVSNPTSGAYLVGSQQFLGIPQQVGSLGFDYEGPNWHGALDVVFRGRNNELNQGPYTLLEGGIGRKFGDADLTLALTNITNQVAGPFTQLGGGVPYLGNGAGGMQLLPTDRYFIEPFGARLIFTVRK